MAKLVPLLDLKSFFVGRRGLKVVVSVGAGTGVTVLLGVDSGAETGDKRLSWGMLWGIDPRLVSRL